MIADITQYGASRGLTTPQTPFIQKAIDACAANGGGVVVIPPGEFLSGTLWLKSHVTLRVEAGGRLVGSDKIDDYRSDTGMFIDAVDQKRGRCLFYGENAENITIEGQGTIDGRGALFGPDGHDRPFLVRFRRCKKLLVRDITLRDSGGWVSHYLECEQVRITGVTIHSHVNGNNDGIDLDSCRGVIVSDCDIDTGDDAICVKSTTGQSSEDILVNNCRIKSDWGALKLGTESVGDYRNIVISNCVIRDTLGGGLKLISMDGCRMENIMVSNIIMDRVSGPIFLRLGARLRKYFDREARTVPGHMKNIVIQNIRGSVWEKGGPSFGLPRRAGICVTGIPGHPIENVLFENIEFTFPGGGTPEEANRREVPELIADYPEFPRFGPLPAWGFYIRHARDIRLKEIRLNVEQPDARTPIVIDDVQELKLTDVETRGKTAEPLLRDFTKS
jgi:polygalacturonase